jgi:hypothetical protein
MNRKQYLALIEPAIAIVAKKHEDYGNDRLGLQSYFPFGIQSHVQMIHVKTQRLVALAQTGAEEPNFESLKDSVLDNINYCVFLLQHLEQSK